MLIGSKGGISPAALATLETRWTPAMADEMRKAGLETPGQLGAMFMGDDRFLRSLTDRVLPVVDDFPLRISNDFDGLREPTQLKAHLVNPRRRQQAFADSEYIRSLFPKTLIDDSLALFEIEATFINYYLPREWNVKIPLLEVLARVLSETELVALPAVLLGSSPAEQALLSEVAQLTSVDHYQSAISREIANRNYAEASSLLEFFLSNIRGEAAELQQFASLYYLSRALAGNLDEAELLASGRNPNFRVSERFVEWMKQEIL